MSNAFSHETPTGLEIRVMGTRELQTLARQTNPNGRFADVAEDAREELARRRHHAMRRSNERRNALSRRWED